MITDAHLCVTACPSGYSQVGTVCVSDPVCVGYIVNGYCLAGCPQGTYPSVGVNSTSNTSQSSCDNCSYNCLICSSVSRCSQCSNSTVSYTTVSSTECLTYCPDGYYNSSGLCLGCPSSCLTCYLSSSGLSCTSCNSTLYSLSEQCLTTCPSGYYSSTSPQSQLICLLCSPICAECSLLSTNCTVCKSVNYTSPACVSLNCSSNQYEAIDGSCVNCDAVCGTCYGGSSYECSSCAVGTFMLNGLCLLSCPEYYYALNGSC